MPNYNKYKNAQEDFLSIKSIKQNNRQMHIGNI